MRKKINAPVVLEPGYGFRLLTKGEQVVRGDDVSGLVLNNGQWVIGWVPTAANGYIIGSNPCDAQYRRAVR